MSDSQIKIKALEEEGAFMGTSNIPKEHSEERSGCTDTDVDVSPKHIPDEIIFSNILTRVPVKSILRFRCVSKNWGSILHSSSFCEMHLTHSQMRRDPTHLLVLVERRNSSIHQFFSMSCRNGGEPITHLLTVSKPSDYTISDNINGLSCFYPSNGSVSDDKCAYICNPSTREVIILPPNPTGWEVSYSFGVDPFTNIFKVLAIHNNLLCDPNPPEFPFKLKARFYTISSHARSWRQINPVLPMDVDDIVFSTMDGKGICINGMIHWMVASKMAILTFCLRDEKIGLMPLPKEVIRPDNGPFFSKSLIQIGGCLTFTVMERTSTKQLWILKDYKNQVWVKKSITFPFSDWTFPYLISSFHTGEVFFRRPGFHHVVRYDMKTKTFRRFQLAQLPKGYEITAVTTYLESLLSLRDDWTGSDGICM